MPVGVVSRQAGDLQAHDDAGATHADLADQPLKTFAPGRRGAGLALIAVDDGDLLVAPAQRDRATAERILPFGALDVLETCRIEDCRMYR